MSDYSRPAVPPRRRERPNLKQEVGVYLRDQILSGALRPGDKIDQDTTAAELGVSKLPVREALITLETEGLVENVARRGSFVSPLVPDDVLDHYAIYGLVAGLAAERAATRLSDEDLEYLERLAHKMETSDHPAEQEELNFQFHQLINKAGSSRRLLSVIRLLANNMPRQFFEFAADWPKRAHQDHRRIIAALRSRDAAAAARATTDHLREGGQYAVRVLREGGLWSDDEADLRP